MLKKVQINNRSIPVPVPVRNLAEALVWVSETFLKPEEIITKVALNGRELGEYELQDASAVNVALDDFSDLHVKIDSPAELSIQTLDALRNLTGIIGRNLKQNAVICWQTPRSKTPRGLDALHNDIHLIGDLLAHFMELVVLEPAELKGLLFVQDDLRKICFALTESKEHSDWRGYARILLNKLEPLLSYLDEEAGNLQGMVFSCMSEQALEKSQGPL